MEKKQDTGLVRGLPLRDSVGHQDEEGYYIAESSHSFYVFLTSWSKSILGYGRCGAVVQAIAFAKKGAVLYGQVAIKYPHGVDTDGWLLMNERNVFKRLQGGDVEGGQSHPNIVRCLGWIDKVLVDGNIERPALVMEYVDGWTLQEICSRWHRSLWVLMDVIMIRWLIQLGRGLAYLHKNNIVHNDLKLHNVMISKVGQRVKIIDFGMSRVAPLDSECAWQGDMSQLGRMVAQLIAQRSPAALHDYERDPSVPGCENILRNHGASYWGVKTELHRLFDGTMTADEFAQVMEQCRERVLEKQHIARKKMKLDGVDYATELGKYLKRSSIPQLKSQTQGFANSRM